MRDDDVPIVSDTQDISLITRGSSRSELSSKVEDKLALMPFMGVVVLSLFSKLLPCPGRGALIRCKDKQPKTCPESLQELGKGISKRSIDTGGEKLVNSTGEPRQNNRKWSVWCSGIVE
jgi:hypothetical protein